jgi:hypothetical protein
MSQLLYFGLDNFRGYGIVHVVEHYSLGALFFWLVCVEFRLSARAMVIAIKKSVVQVEL